MLLLLYLLVMLVFIVGERLDTLALPAVSPQRGQLRGLIVTGRALVGSGAEIKPSTAAARRTRRTG